MSAATAEPAPATHAPEHAFRAAERLAAEFALRAAEHDRDASFPFENFEALREAGLLNLTVPRELGGDGLGLPAVCRVIGTLAQGDPSTALVLTMHYLQHANIPRNPSWPRHLPARRRLTKKRHRTPAKKPKNSCGKIRTQGVSSTSWDNGPSAKAE